MTVRNRLAVDIGGTFTDLVLSLPNRTLSTKLLTTHDAPDQASETRSVLLRERDQEPRDHRLHLGGDGARELAAEGGHAHPGGAAVVVRRRPLDQATRLGSID